MHIVCGPYFSFFQIFNTIILPSFILRFTDCVFGISLLKKPKDALRYELVQITCNTLFYRRDCTFS